MLCPVTFCVQDRAKQLFMMNDILSQHHFVCPCARYYFRLKLPERYTNVGLSTLHLLHVLCFFAFFHQHSRDSVSYPQIYILEKYRAHDVIISYTVT